MYCSNCGRAAALTHRFCLDCGHSLTNQGKSADETPLDDIRTRVADLEAKLTNNKLASQKFWPRAFAVLGHNLAGWSVVYVPLILIATLAIPTVLRSPKPANEAAAVAYLRKVNTAQATYVASSGQYGTIAQLVTAGLLDPSLLQPNSGYVFSITVEPGKYLATAIPVSDETGRYEYFSAADGVVHFSPNAGKAPAGQAGNPVF
jgi:hypothetical protein